MNSTLLSDTQNPLVIPSGLIGHWSFNDGAGTNPLDFSGNNYTGSVKSSTVAWAQGKLGSGLNFSGTGYVNIGRPSALNTPSFTITLWYKPDTVSAAIKSLIGCSNAVNFGWGLNVDQSSAGSAAAGYVAFWLYNGSWRNVSTTTAYLTVGSWIHIAVTYTNGGNAILYLNGIQVNSTGPWTAITYAASSFLTIGRDLQYGNETLGTLDDVRLYNRALSSDEIVTIYRTSPTGPILQNASFESPSVGTWAYAPAGNLWNMGGSCGISVGSTTWVQGAVYAGSQCSWIQTGGTTLATAMYQSMSFIPGTIYNVYLMGSQRPSFGGNTFGVFIDGNMIGGPFTPAAAGTWNSYTASFTASALVHTLMFTASNPLGGDRSCLIDAVGIFTSS